MKRKGRIRDPEREVPLEGADFSGFRWSENASRYLLVKIRRRE